MGSCLSNPIVLELEQIMAIELARMRQDPTANVKLAGLMNDFHKYDLKSQKVIQKYVGGVLAEPPVPGLCPPAPQPV